LALAACLILLFWATRQWTFRRRLGLLLAGLTVTGLGFVWLPAALQFLALWPLLVGCLTALLWYLRTLARGAPTPPDLRSSAGVLTHVAVFALFSAIGWTTSAAPPGPQGYTVYLLPEPTEEGEKPMVLVPTELLDQLQALTCPPTAGAVLLAANYEGKVADGVVEFEAVFQVQCLTDEATTVAIPLDGVQLQGDVLLDGARANPVPAARMGYVLPVRERGRHKVELHFRVPITARTADREVEFIAPRLSLSRLVFRLPEGTSHPRVLVRQGAQRVTTDDKGTRLEADLGRLIAPVQLRWHQPPPNPEPAEVQYKAAFLWDLQPGASKLTTLVRYTVAKGTVTSLTADLPPELEVRRAETIRPASDNGPRLLDWRVVGSGEKRVLRLEFPSPVSGEVPILLELVPRAPLPSEVTLPLPTPGGQRLAEGSFLAYSASGLETRVLQSLRVTGTEPAKFAAFWPVTVRPDPKTITSACTINRETKDPPVMRLRLDPHLSEARAAQEIVVRAAPRQADVRVSLALSAPAAEEFALVEWLIQSPKGLTVTAVAGPEVRYWNQSGNRVLVWLKQATREAKVELSGWWQLTESDTGASLEVPCLLLPAARSRETTVRLRAEPGLALTPERLDKLQALPESRPAGQELVYKTDQAAYGGTFMVRSAATSATARVLTVARVVDRQLTFTAMIDYTAPRGDLRDVRVRLRNWEGEDVHLNATGVEQTRVRQRAAGDRTWVLDLREGVKTYRLQLSGGMSLDQAAAGVPMPEVIVQGVAQTERWLVLDGPELTGEGAAGLKAVADLAPTWPGEAKRLRGAAAWQVTAADWRLRLHVRERSGETGVRVFLTEQAAAVLDGRRWLHEVVYWLRHEVNTDLNVTFPADAEVVAVSVDGVEVAPLQPDLRRLWLPLPGRAGARRVCLRWRYAESEPLDRPNLQPPRLEGAADGPVVWNVSLPPGWNADPQASDPRPATLATFALLELHRAAAQEEISRDLARIGRDVAGALATAQNRFYVSCREARRALDLAGDGVSETGPSGQPLADWLGELLARNKELAARHGFEEIRAEAEHNARSGATTPRLPTSEEGFSRLAGLGRGRNGAASSTPLPERGTPTFWQTDGDAVPRLRLVSDVGLRDRDAVIASAQWLVVLSVIGALSFFPGLTARLRLLWPEQLALLGVVGWFLTGTTLAVLFLLTFGGFGRILTLFAWLRGRVFRRGAGKG
jgi:hypothetical protein